MRTLEPLPKGWAHAIIMISDREGKNIGRYEILDLRGGENQVRYKHEPMAMLALKCFFLFALILPVYFVCYSSMHLIRLPVVTYANYSLKSGVKQMWTIVRIPFYFIALELAALYGTFKPIEGRALFGHIESLLHDGKSRWDSIQYRKDPRSFFKKCWNMLSSKSNSSTVFVGLCMQPIGPVDDPKVINVQLIPDSQSV